MAVLVMAPGVAASGPFPRQSIGLVGPLTKAAIGGPSTSQWAAAIAVLIVIATVAAQCYSANGRSNAKDAPHAELATPERPEQAIDTAAWMSSTQHPGRVVDNTSTADINTEAGPNSPGEALWRGLGSVEARRLAKQRAALMNNGPDPPADEEDNDDEQDEDPLGNYEENDTDYEDGDELTGWLDYSWFNPANRASVQEAFAAARTRDREELREFVEDEEREEAAIIPAAALVAAAAGNAAATVATAAAEAAAAIVKAVAAEDAEAKRHEPSTEDAAWLAEVIRSGSFWEHGLTEERLAEGRALAAVLDAQERAAGTRAAIEAAIAQRHAQERAAGRSQHPSQREGKAGEGGPDGPTEGRRGSNSPCLSLHTEGRPRCRIRGRPRPVRSTYIQVHTGQDPALHNVVHEV
jgi:hypothetical protein